MEKYKLKNGKKIYLKYFKMEEHQNDEGNIVNYCILDGEIFYASTIRAYDCDTNKEVGYINFAAKYGRCWIYIIEVADTNYLNQGVGQLLLNEFEKHMLDEKIYYIEGKYYPEGAGAKYAKNFYERNDYYLCNDDYKYTIEKNLKRTKVICGKKVEKEDTAEQTF